MGGLRHTVRFTLTIFVLVLFPASCAKKPRPDFASMTDEEKLLIIDWLPLGSQFEDLRKCVPDASDPKPGGPRETISSFRGSLFGQPATFEMNYENGQLSAANWFSKASFDSTTSDSIQSEVSRIYSNRFGSQSVFEGGDAEYAVRTHYWCWNGGSASVNLFGIERPRRSISGGFGIRCPQDPGP
jgi:hypothetical protein